LSFLAQVASKIPFATQDNPIEAQDRLALTALGRIELRRADGLEHS